MVVVLDEPLPSQERQLVRNLKRLRNRSLSNAAWIRDPDHVLAHLSNNPLPTADSNNWPIGSPLAGSLDSAIRATKRFRSYARSHPGAKTPGKDTKADELWSTVLAWSIPSSTKQRSSKGNGLLLGGREPIPCTAPERRRRGTLNGIASVIRVAGVLSVKPDLRRVLPAPLTD